MPSTSDPARSHHETVVSGIYIARDDETLGPYTSLEAAARVASGELRADDFAARKGDPTWVALADFLPLSALGRRAPYAPPTAEPSRPPAPAAASRRRTLAAIFTGLTIFALATVGGARWREQQRAGESSAGSAPAPTSPAAGLAIPAPAVVPPPASPAASMAATSPVPSPPTAPLPVAPPPPPPTPQIAGPLHGALFLTLPDGLQIPLAGVRVAAYPLAALGESLAPKIAEAQAARARLDPLIEAASAKRAARAADEKTALEALRAAGPSDPLRSSLRFAHDEARKAVRTADGDLQYLIEERKEAAGGEVFFHDLPEPAAAAETDSQGRFKLDLPPDGGVPYAVAASARRTADDGTVRQRDWIVKLTVEQRTGRAGLRLDDANCSASSAVGSMIQTAD